RKHFDLPLILVGTSFQRKVWEYIQHIPFGETQTYNEVAQGIGHPNAQRAVGNALHTNPIPIIVPCHRVVRTDGGLGGFGLGIDVKQKLLDFERKHL
ncbi:MAG: methylated-DNA--[protein]-cysteine S-methyltransferase, partial [Candidatus Celaenobacter antarcticus]|nr:methylated-DNA--[protein]-cysteine S-methyltransferase [Candidatus Celaenobacter antarcticus]